MKIYSHRPPVDFLKKFSARKIQLKVNFRRAIFDSKFQRAMAAEAEAAREARAKAIQVSDFTKMVFLMRREGRTKLTRRAIR